MDTRKSILGMLRDYCVTKQVLVVVPVAVAGFNYSVQKSYDDLHAKVKDGLELEGNKH